METPTASKAAPAGSDRGLSASMLAEIKAKQEARASGIFNLNVNNVTNGGDHNGRSRSPPPPVTPKPKARAGSGRKSSGSRLLSCVSGGKVLSRILITIETSVNSLHWRVG